MRMLRMTTGKGNIEDHLVTLPVRRLFAWIAGIVMGSLTLGASYWQVKNALAEIGKDVKFLRAHSWTVEDQTQWSREMERANRKMLNYDGTVGLATPDAREVHSATQLPMVGRKSGE